MEEEEIDRGSQNSMRELQDVFIPTVLNGFDLYDSYTALLHYLFGPRKLIDVVDSAMRMKRHEKMVKEALDVLEHNVINPLRQMLKNLRAQKPVEVHNRLELAYEVYKAYDKHFPETDVCAATEDFFSEVNIMFKTGQISMDWLPEVVLTMFGKSAAFKYAEIPLSRDSAFFEAQQSPVSHCPFTNSFNKAYELLKTGSSDLYANLIKFYFDNNTTIEKEDAISMLETLFSNKDLVLSDANRHWTLAILEKICVNVAADIKRSVFMEAQTQLYAGGFEPKPISNIAMRVAKAVNGIKSHNSVQSDPAAFEALRTELRFLVLIAPKAALHGLFHRCFNNKDSVPAVMKVLQGMQEACNLPVDYRQKTVPMLLVVVDMLIQELRDRLKHPDFTETVSYILGALCRQKRSLIKEKGEGGKFLRSVLGDVVEEYLIKPNQILSHIILPRLFAENKADGELKMVLTALKKILTSIGEKEAPLKYLTKLDVTRIDRVPVPQLICYIHVTMRQSEKTDEEITDICFGVLKALGNKLKEDDVIFPDETKEYLLSKLKNDVWWFRYAVTEWFGHSLGNVPKEIPGGLFHSLDTEVRNNFKELKVDFETAPVGCMLLSLFELALVDVDLADSLLLTGFGTLPSDDLLLDQMAMALCDCCIKSFFSRRIASILPFLDRLMVILDPRAPIPFPMNEVNDNMLQAVRETKAIQILGRATRMSIAKIYHSDSRFLVYYPQASPECPTNPREVADVLLRAFCQLAIEQVNRQIELYRRQKRSREKSKDSDRDSHRLEERLLTQMVVLFQDAVLFTRCEMSKHQALDVLLNRLAEYIREVQAGNRKTTLEHVKIEHKKTTYVHIDRPKDVEPQAVTEPQTTNQTPTKKYLDPHYSHPRQRNVSGHLRPFKYPPNLNRNDQTWKHRGGGGYRGLDGATTAMKAAAHQIPNESTRNQVERRLNEPPAPPPPSRSPSAPQQQQQSTGSQATIQRPPRYHGGQQNRGGRGRGRHQNFRLHPQHS